MLLNWVHLSNEVFYFRWTRTVYMRCICKQRRSRTRTLVNGASNSRSRVSRGSTTASAATDTAYGVKQHVLCLTNMDSQVHPPPAVTSLCTALLQLGNSFVKVRSCCFFHIYGWQYFAIYYIPLLRWRGQSCWPHCKGLQPTPHLHPGQDLEAWGHVVLSHNSGLGCE